MDYFKIGQKIRKFRKAYNMSQDKLAEAVGISTTHLSHIETGNTKLSLPVLVEIANVLNVQTDDLLFDSPNNSVSLKKDICDLLDTCSTKELNILFDILKATKTALDKYE